MKTLFEDELVEATIRLCAAGRLAAVTTAQLRSFHQERERCYGIADPDRRVEAFARFHLDWFTHWGLRARLDGALAHFPLLGTTLEAVVFRQARGRHDEGAELYRDPSGQRRGVLALRPDRLVTEPALMGFLHHELAHLADMVDPDFRYSTRSPDGPRTASEDRLVRERYRILWSIRIDGSLDRRRLASLADEGRRHAEFDRAFGFLDEPRRSSVFEGIWSGRLGNHEELLHLATDPRELAGARQPTPGAPCPLCGFAAFRWADASVLRPAALARVRTEFPHWHEDEPLCARCAEIYDAITGIEYPPTALVAGHGPTHARPVPHFVS